MNHDNETLKLLYGLSGHLPYKPTKSWTCVKEFVPLYSAVQKEFKLNEPLKQLVETDGFEPPCC